MRKLILRLFNACLMLTFLIQIPLHLPSPIKLPLLEPITGENIYFIESLGSIPAYLEGVVSGYITNITISPNSRWLVINFNGNLVIYDLINGQVKSLGRTTDFGVGGFSNDNQLYLMPHNNGTTIYQTHGWTPIGSLPDGFIVGDVLFSPDNRFLITQYESMLIGYTTKWRSNLYIFETTHWTQYNRLTTTSYRNYPMMFLADHPHILLTRYDIGFSSSIYGWDYIHKLNYTYHQYPTKAELLANLATRWYPSPYSFYRYDWIAYQNADRDYGIWVTLADTQIIFATDDCNYEYAMPWRSGLAHDSFGIPKFYAGYTRLVDNSQMLTRYSQFCTPMGRFVINGNSLSLTRPLPLYNYNPMTDTLYDNESKITYQNHLFDNYGVFLPPLDEYDSFYQSEYQSFPYRFDNYQLPEHIAYSDNREELGFMDFFTQDGRYVLAKRGKMGEETYFLYDLLTQETRSIFEGIHPIENEHMFDFYQTIDAKVALTVNPFYQDGEFIDQFQLWDMGTGQEIIFDLTEENPTNILLSQDGRLLILFSGGIIEFWGVRRLPYSLE